MKLPKKPKAPKSQNPDVWKRYLIRLKEHNKKVAEIKKRPSELAKLKDTARKLRG